MPVRLIDSLTTSPQVDEIFSDSSVVQAMVTFEVALAQVESRLAVIPLGAAETIARASASHKFDVPAITQAALHSATPAVPFVKQFTEIVGSVDSAAAGFVHWGATSQDLCDSAMVLLLQRVQAFFASELERLESDLIDLSSRHAQTVMLGRTLLQPATPITFGLKAAGWLGSIHRARVNLDQAFTEALVLQFGGASGTLAALGHRGLEVAQALSRELHLSPPDAPWHSHRDRLATLMTSCGVLVGVLAKMAQDVLLMSQPEVGEAREAAVEGRGGSSTMPHKQNPVGCVLALSAANRTPGLIANFLHGMAQEHERAAGRWQGEWSTIADIMSATGLAITSLAGVADGLTVDAARMRANIEATQGRIFAERAMILLAPKLGRTVAHKLVEDATRRSLEQHRHLKEVLAEMKEVREHLTTQEIGALEDSQTYLGSAETFRRRIIDSVQKNRTRKG